MSAAVTVVFAFDLASFSSNTVNLYSEDVFQKIRQTLEDAQLPSSTLAKGNRVQVVLELPKNTQALADLVFWCGAGQFPYKTLWLNDVAHWQDGVLPPWGSEQMIEMKHFIKQHPNE